jgi:metal-dependent amidase/aminoacylase/carboxypeptidase family protein
MYELNPTALFVDLKGKGAPSGNPKCIAFRADIDALPIM